MQGSPCPRQLQPSERVEEFRRGVSVEQEQELRAQPKGHRVTEVGCSRLPRVSPATARQHGRGREDYGRRPDPGSPALARDERQRADILSLRGDTHQGSFGGGLIDPSMPTRATRRGAPGWRPARAANIANAYRRMGLYESGRELLNELEHRLPAA